jgi:hypothetical protein
MSNLHTFHIYGVEPNTYRVNYFILLYFETLDSDKHSSHGTLTEGEGSVQLTSLY